ASGATVTLGGAQQTGAVQFVSSGEIKVPALIQSPGMVSLSVVNPFPFGPTDVLSILSQPNVAASSSAVAVIVGRAGVDSTGAPITASKAFIPQPGSQSLAVVNLESGKQIASVVLPAGFTPSMTAADSVSNQVVVASTASNMVQVLDANSNALVQSFAVPVTTTTTVDGGTCMVCAMLVDSGRNLALLDTAAGYFTLNLTTGATSTPLAVPAAAAFSYDASTQRIYAPFHDSTGSGMNVLDLDTGAISRVQTSNGVPFGIGADTATLDPATQLVTVGDSSTGSYLELNFNNALSQSGMVSVAAAPFTITSSCAGVW